MTIWRRPVGRCMPKDKNTYSEYAILITFLLQQWLCERASLLRYITLSVLFNITYTVTIPTVLI